jgi:predicted KAP-like P-loop ATPase
MTNVHEEQGKVESANTFVSDGAITNPSLDRFRRWPFALRIAQTIATREDPNCIVIGIYGAWGEGKTTVLNFIQHELKQYPNIIPVKFNPWRFGDEATLLKSFFKTLADALKKSLSTSVEKIGEWLQEYGAILSPISLTLSGVVSISPGEGTKEFGKSLSAVELDTLKERIEKYLKDAKVRVVILMDDIDRLDKVEINNVFKLIKLTADFSYTAYVLAFDNRMAAAALREKYVSADTDAGESFLDKIIQVPLHLPKADTIALRKLCFEGVEQAIHTAQIDVTQDQANEFVRHFISGLEIRLQTPRSAKRYSNALLFALPILKGEVNSIDLMLIEGIRVFYPRLYTFIRANSNLFLQSSSKYSGPFGEDDKKKQALLSSAFEGLTSDEAQAATSLLKELFPCFGKMGYGSNWEETWAKGKRIASEFYFGRYFSYAIPEGDVSDVAIEDFISNLSKLSVEEIVVSLNEIVTPRNADNLVLKLRD